LSESDKENVREENAAEKLADQKATIRMVSEYQDINKQDMTEYEEPRIYATIKMKLQIMMIGVQV